MTFATLTQSIFCNKMPPIFPSPWWDASPRPPLYLHALSGSPEKPRGRVWANRVCTFCNYVGMYVCIPLTILWNPLKLTGERSIERVELLFKYKEITRPKKPHLVLINICHWVLHQKLPCYANACPLSWHWNKATRKQCLLLQQVSQDLYEKKNSKQNKVQLTRHQQDATFSTEKNCSLEFLKAQLNVFFSYHSKQRPGVLISFEVEGKNL